MSDPAAGTASAGETATQTGFGVPAGRLLTGQVALVTGGARGIGFAISRALVREGATVAIVSRDAERGQAAAGELGQAGGTATMHAADLRSGEAVQAAFQEVLKAHGRLDILVNNSVVTRDGLLLRMSDEQWEEVLSEWFALTPVRGGRR